MIIVRLMGGLGNQMFQYAAGRRLAYTRQVALKIDTSYLDHQAEIAPGDTLRYYSLAGFNLQGTPASPQELARYAFLWKKTLPARLARAALRRLPFRAGPVYWEKGSGFDPGVLRAGRSVYLSGYWQSWRYFAGAEDVLRREFTLREAFHPANRRLAAEIEAVTAVGVHVRRGDYVTNLVTARYHGICSLDYYRQAIRVVAAQVPEPHLFVFSDDPDWAGEHFTSDILFPASQPSPLDPRSPGSPVTIVDNRALSRDDEDLILLSRCRHFIIANSSFSWWAAWLGAAPGKIVVAPRRWRASAADEPADLMPAEWTRI